MTDSQNPKRYKTLLSWLKSGTSSSASEQEVENETRGETINEETEKQSDIEFEDVQDNDITSLERDPGKRRPIGTYPLNERDNVRKAFVVHGPFRPHLQNYPSTQCGDQGRSFCSKWFKEWSWLEYSIHKDKAYCFPCFLFDEYPSRYPSFTEIGYNGWKNAMCRKSGIAYHIGGRISSHNTSMSKWENLRNPSRHIEKVINKLSSQEIANNRRRLVASIEAVKLLARQGCAFRGNDESIDPANSGNSQAVLDSFKKMNDEVKKVIDLAPGNAKYACSSIQKQIANILANKVRAKIRDDLGDSKFTILVDEALDMLNKEQMAIIIRFVDCEGLIRERFFKVISVGDTCSQTLKDVICKVFDHYHLLVENMRGQGYDGASNMRGKFNVLQALFLQECPYAYYVHCFAYRLQLSLNVASNGAPDVWQFFSTLTLIVNFVDSSAKRHSMLKAYRGGELSDFVAAGTIESETGKNQACSLQRAGATRWGSHFRSISSLIKLFGATRATIDDLFMNGVDKVQGEAKAVDDLFMNGVDKDLDILNALNFLSLTKEKLQSMRENGWGDLIMKVGAFCSEHDITMPDMTTMYKKGIRNCDENITNEHYYRVNLLCGVIDFQLAELESIFSESSLEILLLSASFDPRHDFGAFKREDVCKLASKYYPSDFSSHDMLALELECEFFVADVQKDPSATTERAFSSMKIIKNKLRNKISDNFLDDLMILYIERMYADNIDNDDVIREFELRGPRRVSFT